MRFFLLTSSAAVRSSGLSIVLQVAGLSLLTQVYSVPLAQGEHTQIDPDWAPQTIALTPGSNPSPDPYPLLRKPRVTFKPDGTFKLTVFSDLHYGEAQEVDWGPEQDRKSARLMRRVLSEEKPDYVVLNGDLITGENTQKENATTYIDILVQPLNEARTPFSSTHGNHDNQRNITHADEIERERKVAPLSYTRSSPPGVGGDRSTGLGNYWVPVYPSKHAHSPNLILWFFDSRGGVAPQPNTTETTRVPDWIDPSVVPWLEDEQAKMEKAWGPANKTRASLAFMHIAPFAIKALQPGLDSVKNPGQNADRLGRGSVQASGSSEDLGNDTPVWNAVTKIANLRAIISGHDHGNEWCAREPTKDVIFCFDKHSGFGGYSKEGWGHGVRNLVFSMGESGVFDPQSPINTWIRLEEGEVRAPVVLDDEYGR